ncbi:MAG: hypothetical protein KKB31_00015 [Nanoarchaeota archaeon]|nr:hypothetical protein [Nanoarchaeota archaeon]
MRNLTNDELCERGYTDITSNLPVKDLLDEINLITRVRPHVKEIVIRYDHEYRKATLYITQEDFSKNDRN